jgi:beta-ketoacyl ACP synthase
LNGGFPNVVVTSLAATTSIAGDVDATWKGLLNGESGIDILEDAFVEEFDLPVRIGGHLKVKPSTLLTRVELRRLAYVEQMATVLGREVWRNAGSPDVDKDRLGVAIGTGLGGADALVDSVDKLKNGGYR